MVLVVASKDFSSLHFIYIGVGRIVVHAVRQKKNEIFWCSRAKSKMLKKEEE